MGKNTVYITANDIFLKNKKKEEENMHWIYLAF